MIEKINNKNYPSKILGLDISTACIGVSIIIDNGETIEIEKITHITPKIPHGVTGIEALFKRKEIFETEFLSNLKDEGITECVIEAPLMLALGNSNPTTVTQLIKFNTLISESIYYKLGIVPYFISSLDSRVYAFPELLGIRKFSRNGKTYDITHIKKSASSNKLVAFADYPFDCDKKNVIMNIMSEKYPEINWTYNKSGDFKKENYDACDSLVCALAYSNIKKYGEMAPIIKNFNIIEENGVFKIKYDIYIWDSLIHKEMLI